MSLKQLQMDADNQVYEDSISVDEQSDIVAMFTQQDERTVGQKNTREIPIENIIPSKHNKFEPYTGEKKGIKRFKFFKKYNQKLYVSYCLLCKYCINFFGIQEGILYLLGYDYLSVIDWAKGKKKEMNLQDFGSALCEESRVKILELLLEREELTCKDLEKLFGFWLYSLSSYNNDDENRSCKNEK